MIKRLLSFAGYEKTGPMNRDIPPKEIGEKKDKTNSIHYDVVARVGILQNRLALCLNVMEKLRSHGRGVSLLGVSMTHEHEYRENLGKIIDLNQIALGKLLKS